MSMEIVIGWWIIPALLSIAAIWWTTTFNYRGDYNFTALFTYPVAALAMCFVWMIYFAIGWALA